MWHEGLCHVGPTKEFNFDEGIVELSEALHNVTNSAVLKGSEIVVTFQTTRGVHQGYILLPARFDLFLENTIMTQRKTSTSRSI